MVELQVVGGGRMGEALVGGLLRAGDVHAAEVRIVEAVAERRTDLAERFAGVEVTDTAGPAVGTVLAVKPADVRDAARAVAAAGTERALSIAAGVTLAALESALGAGVPVVRAMPNTPALVGVGAAAIAGGSSAEEGDLAWAERLLGAVGTVVRVDEALLDAVTGLSGSGPAYVFLVAEALMEAGAQAGLPAEVSASLTVQTLLGAATLLARSDEGPEALRAAVTSPGGTTAAGVRVLEERGLRTALVDAVAAATERSRELGQQPQEPL